MRKSLLVFWGLLLLAASSRFVDLGERPFQEDEASTLQAVLSQSPIEVLAHPFEPTNPPLFFFLAKASSLLFGVNEFSLRLPSVVFGLLSVWVLYRLAMTLGRPYPAPAVALLAALSPGLVLYSQFARSYSLLVFLSLCSLWAFVAFIKTGRARHFLWMLLCNLSGIWTHYLFAAVLVSDTLFFLLRRKALNRRLVIVWIGSLALMGLFLLPALPILWRLHQWSIQAGPPPVPLVARVGLAFFSFSLGESVYPFFWPVVLPAALLFGSFFFVGLRSWMGKKQDEGLLILLRLVVPLAVWSATGGVTTRYVVFVIPLFLLIVVQGLEVVTKGKPIRVLALLCLIGLESFSVYNWYRRDPNQVLNANLLIPWKEIEGDLEHRRQAGDSIFVYPSHHEFLFRYYYPTELPKFEAIPFDEKAQSLNRIRQEKLHRIWWVDMPSRIFHDEAMGLPCYRPFYEKGYLLNPRLAEQFATGRKTTLYAVTLRGYERVRGCD